jgi:hypothetical protein
VNWIPLLLTGAAAVSAGDLPGYVREPHVPVLGTWLSAHPGYRLAIDNDCECAAEIEELRRGDGGAWRPQPDFHPYYAAGDFDGDGFEDLAVVALPRKPDDQILIVVLLGAKPGAAGDVTVIPKGGRSVADRGLFIARSADGRAPKHPVLLFGAFGSEGEPVPIRRSPTPTR